ncbi:MAG TPA: helix-turn-helix transcriptional regulator [Anaerolineaceae bacterium]|nr:helix-turn-helix transcriptional regulator [Anaerolineaceae bacterium]
MDEQFAKWINNFIQNKGWTQAELARRANLSKASISDISSGKIIPGFDTCIKLAKAMSISPQDVLRKANLLPSVSSSQEEQENLIFLFDSLTPEKKAMLLSYAKFLNSSEQFD